jgi:hypothetical protein
MAVMQRKAGNLVAEKTHSIDVCKSKNTLKQRKMYLNPSIAPTAVKKVARTPKIMVLSSEEFILENLAGNGDVVRKNEYQEEELFKGGNLYRCVTIVNPNINM